MLTAQRGRLLGHLRFVVDCLFSNLDTLVMILAILTGVFGAVGVTLLVVLIVIFRKVPRRRRKELEL